MSRIGEKFTLLKKQKKSALMPFITAGDPDIALTGELILEMEKRGADLIELGVPFSDPLADGPTIQRSYIRALENKVSLKKIIAMVKSIRHKTDIPIVLMSSYNVILRYGEKKMIRDAAKAGVDGLIIPDLPPEDAVGIISFADKLSIDIICLLAPTTKKERIRLICEKCRGFIYYISLEGITGARRTVNSRIKSGVKKIKQYTDLPVAVGFGISTPAHAAEVSSYADGIIVGSANVKIIEKYKDNKKMIVQEVGNFIATLRKDM